MLGLEERIVRRETAEVKGLVKRKVTEETEETEENLMRDMGEIRMIQGGIGPNEVIAAGEVIEAVGEELLIVLIEMRVEEIEVMGTQTMINLERISSKLT